MHNLSFFSEAFSINKTSTYILSLELNHFGYTYKISDSIRKTYIALKHTEFNEDIVDKSYTEKVKFMLKNDAFLKKSYKTVNFCFKIPKTTIIPETLFDKKYLKDFFAYTQKIDDLEELHFNHLPLIGAYNVFVVHSEITTLLVNHFPEIRFYNQAGVIISNAIEKSKKTITEATFVYIDVNRTFFDICIVKSGELKFFNSFDYDKVNDFVYHVLNILNQFGIKINKSEIYLSGDIDKNTEIYKRTKQFIPNFKTAKTDGSIKYIFDEIPEHLLFNTLNMHKCE